MRADQLERLKRLQEDQFDGMLEELDEPLVGSVKADNGAVILKPSQMLSQTERGNRYWQKKNVSASLVVATKIDLLRARLERAAYLETGESASDSEIGEEEFESEYQKLAAQSQKLFDEFEKSRTEH